MVEEFGFDVVVAFVVDDVIGEAVGLLRYFSQATTTS